MVWGVIASLTGIVHSYGALIACRLLLGIFEAGLFPGLVVYLTMFYTKKELALRVGYLFVSAALAGAVGGLIAYGIGFMDGTSGLRAWRWIMIIEGFPSFLTGLACWVFLPHSPETAGFLGEEDRALLVSMRQREIGQTADAQQFHWADAKEGVKDWQVWIFCVAAFCEDTMLYGFSTFLPTIINGIGKWTAPQVQALTIPIYAVGAISYLVMARISDKQQRRGLYASSFAFISVIGYVLLISSKNSAANLVGCFMVALGLYVSLGIPLAWLPSNKPRYGKRAVATGMQLTFGNLSGVAAPFLFPTNNAPRYFMGYGVTMALICLSGTIFAFMTMYYARINRNRRAGKEDWKTEGKDEHEIENMGDFGPRFEYTE